MPDSLDNFDCYYLSLFTEELRWIDRDDWRKLNRNQQTLNNFLTSYQWWGKELEMPGSKKKYINTKKLNLPPRDFTDEQVAKMGSRFTQNGWKLLEPVKVPHAKPIEQPTEPTEMEDVRMETGDTLHPPVDLSRFEGLSTSKLRAAVEGEDRNTLEQILQLELNTKNRKGVISLLTERIKAE